MGIQAAVTAAIDSGRDELVAVLARNRVLPAVDEAYGGSDLLGGSSSPTVRLDPQCDDTGVLDRQTKAQVLDALGLKTPEDCEDARATIRDHPTWDE
jgi:hypothetical protein